MAQPPDDLRERVAQAQAGDVAAISELYDRYASSLLRYILGRGAEPELAQDLTQEVFIRVIKGIGKFEYRDEKSFLSWLYTIAGNVLTSHYRRRRPISTPLDAQDEATLAESHSETIRAFDRIVLQQAMGQLTDDQQQVLALRFFADMSNSEIAEALQRSEGAIKAIQHRAIHALQRILARDGDEPLATRPPAARAKVEPGSTFPNLGLGNLKNSTGD